jgi:putative SOS response-associated peptidase YedK
MPVILSTDAYDVWLDPGFTDVVAASEMLNPCDAWLMRSYAVSARVNSVANDGAECCAPVELAESQARLF